METSFFGRYGQIFQYIRAEDKHRNSKNPSTETLASHEKSHGAIHSVKILDTSKLLIVRKGIQFLDISCKGFKALVSATLPKIKELIRTFCKGHDI